MYENIEVLSTNYGSDGNVKVNYKYVKDGEMMIEGFVLIQKDKYMYMNPIVVRKYIAKKWQELGQQQETYWQSEQDKMSEFM